MSVEDSHVDVLHEISARLGTADGFRTVLTRVVEFATAPVECDSCLIYVLEGDELVLRASKNPHPELVDRLKLRVRRGITGWVAEYREPVAISGCEKNSGCRRSVWEYLRSVEEAFQGRVKHTESCGLLPPVVV